MTKLIFALFAVFGLLAGSILIAKGVSLEGEAAEILRRGESLEHHFASEAINAGAYRFELMGMITLLLGVVAMGFGSIPDMRPKPQVAQQPNVQPPQPQHQQYPPQYPQPPQG